MKIKPHISNINDVTIHLPKWPGLLVTGKSVTKEQAMEILIRTDTLYFSTNDTSFEKQLNNEVFGAYVESVNVTDHATKLLTEKLGRKPDGRRMSWDWREEQIEPYKLLPLNYLNNHRIVTAYIGGSYGWCDWDGEIFCDSFNIGKHPSIIEVYDDWRMIAEAFPFLDLKSQLLNCEAGEVDVESKSLIEFRIKNGRVTINVNPTKQITPPKHPNFDFDLYMRNERGCTIEIFREALNYVKNKHK